ncbi:aspartate aminotransferase family protein [Crocinitomicaceae bacterium]|nr:aspartate aminotransferase family protein [Crocinitomicaceae bacterium]
MDSKRKSRFLKQLAPTNDAPYLIDVAKAEGIYIWDQDGKRYMDMIAGVAVNNVGHRHPKVTRAIKEQLDKYMHVMVYGEYVQDAALQLAENLASILPDHLSCTYMVNSGTEANEGAIKLAKRITGRKEIIAYKGAYHGATHGSLSVSHNEIKKSAFRPLLPGIKFLTFNSLEELSAITEKTAAVIIEPIQGDAGVRIPNHDFMKALRNSCDQTGTQLIFDEVQTGMGRTGKNFAFEHFNVAPDILTLGKALGGGMPVGAFISSHKNMQLLTHNPMLGHITTFGGNPVIAAAANATVELIKSEKWVEEAESKGLALEKQLIQSPEINEIRRAGLMFAIEMADFDRVKKVVDCCLEKGLIGFWFLSCPNSFRLSPPLSITMEQIKEAGKTIIEAIKETA